MTKSEVKNIIETKAAEYGFTMKKTLTGWQSYTGITTIEITTDTNYDNTDWEAHKVEIEINAAACISQMGGHPTPEELLKAADEIARAAKFTDEIICMNLTYTETF